MRFLHFWIFEIILVSSTIFGQYFDETPTSSERSSDEEEKLIGDIFDIPTISNPFIDTENVTNIGNTGDVVGNCKCLPNELCETAFLR